MQKPLLWATCLALSLGSCVSKKKFDSLTEEKNSLAKDNQKLLDRIDSLGFQSMDLKSQLELSRKMAEALRKDSIECAEQIVQLKKNNKEQSAKMAELVRSSENSLAANQSENARLAARLRTTELQLEQKAKNLTEREAETSRLAQELSATRKDLEAREKKLKELESVLSRKDSVVNALQRTVTRALNGFTGSGLNVTKKNGKIYVSLSEQLLFASGSRQVETRGKQALKELAKVLENNPDINVMVEGHTDDVGETYYNWDLSVERATSIVRILTEGTKIDPLRITAAGRGKYSPIDPAKTPEARSRNRRTEIILTPKLDDLFSIIESN